MPVRDVRVVGILVCQHLMPVRMCMGLGCLPVECMLMLVVLVVAVLVAVLVTVLERLMGVLVLMPLSCSQMPRAISAAATNSTLCTLGHSLREITTPNNWATEK